ncbi:hypothetical protein ENUP19_0122G0014 [Entamoeba nuttalli]|uniref:Replication factor C subunit 1 n=2 Tax=Entamoeba nuttalli TaxID=412467 RepID=K2GPQ4_ENTNP|nr:activator 1 140 kda subunit, putative [Entamoeba nuttalli P19]EKE36933.1 activator 1 140 kda subunit, putative [Entamoeba nuttalli P19]|eukprot:XP_008860736.1 activator 1 140 kda subunit, putative [Entamoeba nuttalli P19]
MGSPPTSIQLSSEKKESKVQNNDKEVKKPKMPSSKTSKKKINKQIKSVTKEQETNEQLDSIEEQYDTKTETKISINVIVKKTTIEPNKQKKTSKPIESKKTHFNAFSHDTTAKNKGSKIIPRGVGNFFGENEFQKKNFVLTGVYDELDRDEMKEYIISFGGNVATSISGKTAVLIAGEEAGPSKIEKAKEKGIPIWSEDDVFNYVKQKLGNNVITTSIPNQTNNQKQQPTNVDENTTVINSNEIIWTEKYRPQTKSDLIGNKNQIAKFYTWINKWEKVIPDRRAVLLAGAPGVGKTTVSKIVGKTLGFNPIEFNASDTRNKSSIELAIKRIFLNGQISIDGSKNKKPLIIMDEVDGMSSGDRGGITELVKYIKETEQPIVCICNDIMDKKMQPLINVCETINFSKISVIELTERLKYICDKEGVHVSDENLNQIASKAHGDVRYGINMLQSFVKCGVTLGEKNEDVDYVEIVPTLITRYSSTSFIEKNEIFFMDNFMMPIYLHDSLLRAQKFSALSKSFGSFAIGDIFQNVVNKTQNWKLMPITGIFKVCLSTYYGQTTNPGMKVMFPKTLGKISKRGGNQTRLLMLTNKTPGKFMDSRGYAAIPMMYIRNTIIRLMSIDVKQAVAVALKFGLEKEIWDEMVKIGISLEKVELFKSVSTANKTKFTKELKQATTPVIKETKGSSKKTKKEYEDDLEEMSESIEEDEEDNEQVFDEDMF